MLGCVHNWRRMQTSAAHAWSMGAAHLVEATGVHPGNQERPELKLYFPLVQVNRNSCQAQRTADGTRGVLQSCWLGGNRRRCLRMRAFACL